MRYILITGILVSLLLAPLCGSKAQAEEGLFSLTKDLNYDITVQLSQGIISKIKNIHVVGTVEIAGKVFLVAEFQNEVKAANSLIALDSIKTIVPSNTAHETLIADNSLK
ncbi:MAG: hypothetical protein KKC39_04190 [Candidatus Omnitrophica bacterium]|nr:hypothetical protein [Candidatus Omnitrophota bacterium]MBU4418912.1 hypothetical protein [Candidatus Omnitrophota bacterium]MBU4467923.1 hypothetical protein [Candidatus Omnitrophota bacterium]MCG2713396.1 hypothetical protein [Candidatus Omnitrophota bacterium]